MTGQEVNLQQMLQRRELRASQQNKLAQNLSHSASIISFTMNIPGPIKTNELIRTAFDYGKNLLIQKLNGNHAKIIDLIEIHELTGDELLLAVDGINSHEIKTLSVNIENDSQIGRLFDIDVIDSNGHKLSRENFRKCLICGKQAQECARNRTHSVQEMQNVIENMLINWSNNHA